MSDDTNVIDFTSKSKEAKELPNADHVDMDDEKQKAIDVAIQLLEEPDTFKGFMLFLLPHTTETSDVIIGGTIDVEKTVGAMEHAKFRLLNDFVRLGDVLDNILGEDNGQTSNDDSHSD